MARSKATVYLDPNVLRATRVLAARTGKRYSDVVEEALREYLGIALLEEVWKKADLTEEEALQLAYDELRQMRGDRLERPS
ncbi:MAG: hypothetical protein M3R26_07680 [Actinomycetota bacterium]|nr:hypothetical protein [Actinomycetota bacterium]